MRFQRLSIDLNFSRNSSHIWCQFSIFIKMRILKIIVISKFIENQSWSSNYKLGLFSDLGSLTISIKVDQKTIYVDNSKIKVDLQFINLALILFFIFNSYFKLNTLKCSILWAASFRLSLKNPSMSSFEIVSIIILIVEASLL